MRKREGDREREREICPELLFLFLKGMTGALAPTRMSVQKTICKLLEIIIRVWTTVGSMGVDILDSLSLLNRNI